MSDTPEYITARPVTLQEVQEWATAEVTPEPLFVPLDRQALTEQLLKLIEDHNDGLLFTASSCSDYFREEEARGLLSWAAAKSEDGNSMNTFLAKDILVLFGLENKENK